MRYYLLLLCLSVLPALAQTPDTTRRKAAATSTSQGPSALETTDANLRANVLQGAGITPNSFILTVDNRYEGLVGTPYFLPKWTNGQVDLVGGKTYTNVPLKFDAARQALILLRPRQGNDSIIIDRATVQNFRLDNGAGQVYLFRRYPSAKTSEAEAAGGYFLVLHEGKTSLLKRVSKTFQAADFKGAYASGDRYDTFTDANTYYLLKPDQSLTKVKLSKKSLLDALADKRDALKPAADKLSLKTEADAIALVKEYDGL
ncbi:hypothetical protein [Spirosoma montaniterrae]|uniref:Uncharacterized protein n=1 Tax=Spirosoma montaniterrae TaxID=1178516 RepID=A0A1P9WT05_9BACT|nr:hypothetical protein [Spirosoma montaniterrae]AQG78492.1 hypothetical protein AWR27_03535 [Spirosoma montaniterrae]